MTKAELAGPGELAVILQSMSVSGSGFPVRPRGAAISPGAPSLRAMPEKSWTDRHAAPSRPHHPAIQDRPRREASERQERAEPNVGESARAARHQRTRSATALERQRAVSRALLGRPWQARTRAAVTPTRVGVRFLSARSTRTPLGSRSRRLNKREKVIKLR